MRQRYMFQVRAIHPYVTKAEYILNTVQPAPMESRLLVVLSFLYRLKTSTYVSQGRTITQQLFGQSKVGKRYLAPWNTTETGQVGN